MKRFIRSSLCAALVVVMVLGSTLSVSAMKNYNRWNYGQERQVNRLMLSKEEINDEGKTQQYIEYTYDDEGRMLTADYYEDKTKAVFNGKEKYIYENNFKKVTIEDYNTKNVMINKIIYEYVSPFDVLKNYEEQPYTKSTEYEYDATTGKERSRIIVDFSADFKEKKEQYSNLTENGEWYTYAEFTDKFNKSFFDWGNRSIYYSNIGYNEDGTIDNGSEEVYEYNEHGNEMSHTVRSYYKDKAEFVDDTYETHEYKYDGDKIIEDLYISRRADAPVTTATKKKTTYSYTGNKCERITYAYLEEQYKQNNKVVTTYDEKGFEIKSDYYSYVASDWVLSYTYEYEYDSKNRNTCIKYLSYSEGKIVGGDMDSHEYDELGNETLYSHSRWSTEKNDFVFSSSVKNAYTYSDYKEYGQFPQTGDTSNMTLWFMLTALSSMGLYACLAYGKKRKNEQ